MENGLIVTFIIRVTINKRGISECGLWVEAGLEEKENWYSTKTNSWPSRLLYRTLRKSDPISE